MFRILFLLFIIVPIIEISVLMQVGQLLGVWPTVAIVIITAWLGAKNVRQQGIATVQSLQMKMAQGEMPSDEIVAGLLLLVAGVTLITPGFVTDAFGLLLLVPAFRKGLVKSVQKHIVTTQVHSSHAQYGFHQQSVDPIEKDPFVQKPQSHHQGQTLDGEYERKE